MIIFQVSSGESLFFIPNIYNSRNKQYTIRVLPFLLVLSVDNHIFAHKKKLSIVEYISSTRYLRIQLGRKYPDFIYHSVPYYGKYIS